MSIEATIAVNRFGVGARRVAYAATELHSVLTQQIGAASFLHGPLWMHELRCQSLFEMCGFMRVARGTRGRLNKASPPTASA